LMPDSEAGLRGISPVLQTMACDDAGLGRGRAGVACHREERRDVAIIRAEHLGG
jgi:hypothetical protein